MTGRNVQSLLSMYAQATRGLAAVAGAGPGRKVAVLGAAGGIGQPLSMLMKVRGRWGWLLAPACVPHTPPPPFL